MPEAYTVALTPGALADLDRLDRFLRQKNPAAADRMFQAFDTAFARLAENPFVSPALPTTTLRARTVRFGKDARKTKGRRLLPRLLHECIAPSPG